MTLLTTAELAEHTGLAVTTIRDRIYRGLLTPTVQGTNNTPHMFSPDMVKQLQQVKSRNRSPELLTTKELAQRTGYSARGIRYMASQGRVEIAGTRKAAHGGKPEFLFRPDALAPKPGYVAKPKVEVPTSTDRPCKLCVYCSGSLGQCTRWWEYVGPEQTCAAWMRDMWREQRQRRNATA